MNQNLAEAMILAELQDLNKKTQLQNEMLYQLLRVQKNMAVKGETMADFNERLG